MYCGTQAYALMSCEAEPEEAATRFALQLIMASASWHRLHGLASWHRLHGIGEEAATRLPTTDSLWTDDLSKDNEYDGTRSVRLRSCTDLLYSSDQRARV